MDNQIHCNDQFARIETTCALLLLELQKIWDEVGETDDQRDKLVFEIEQECVQVYRRKVDEAATCRSELQQAIAVAEMEIESICSELGEQPVKHEQIKIGLNLKEELQAIIPRLEEMRKRRAERKKQFVEVVEDLQDIAKEIFGSADDNLCKMAVDGADLSMKKLEELQKRLQELQNEKNYRLKQVLGLVNSLNSLCGVLGMDYKHTIHEIHPTLNDSGGVKGITDDIIKRLVTVIQSFREVKMQRMQRLQDLATALLELWNLMDTPVEEQRMFQSVTSYIAASEPEITEPNMLSVDFINHIEEEVSRLELLKASKVKELVLKRRLELEEISRKAHMVTEALAKTKYSTEAVTSGAVDPLHLLEEIELEIAKVKDEAFSRKEILEKVDKWLAACEEECWLEEYNLDENRYNAGRGAHLNLKRAEKARAVVNKIPAMVGALASKTIAWEKERGIQFLYDGGRLLSRLEEYINLRQEKEKARLRQRDQKRFQIQLIAEQEAVFGSKSSPSKSGMKASRTSIGVASNRKLSLGGAMLTNFKAERASPLMHPTKNQEFLNQNCYSTYQQYGGFASSGRRTSEIAGRLVKQHSTAAKARETESRLIRKPLSPVSLAISSKANIANFLEDKTIIQSGRLHTSLPCVKTPKGARSKYISVGDGENRNPKTLPIPVPTTPPTMSAPMLMALTPATPYVSSSAKPVKKTVEQVEYSFEEIRAGFICPKPQSSLAFQV